MQGEKDWEKYEIARKLKSCVDSIRNQYLKDLKSREMGTRQRAVALYFIDKVCFEELSCIFAVSRVFILVSRQLPEISWIFVNEGWEEPYSSSMLNHSICCDPKAGPESW